MHRLRASYSQSLANPHYPLYSFFELPPRAALSSLVQPHSFFLRGLGFNIIHVNLGVLQNRAIIVSYSEVLFLVAPNDDKAEQARPIIPFQTADSWSRKSGWQYNTVDSPGRLTGIIRSIVDLPLKASPFGRHWAIFSAPYLKTKGTVIISYSDSRL